MFEDLGEIAATGARAPERGRRRAGRAGPVSRMPARRSYALLQGLEAHTRRLAVADQAWWPRPSGAGWPRAGLPVHSGPADRVAAHRPARGRRPGGRGDPAGAAGVVDRRADARRVPADRRGAGRRRDLAGAREPDHHARSTGCRATSAMSGSTSWKAFLVGQARQFAAPDAGHDRPPADRDPGPRRRRAGVPRPGPACDAPSAPGRLQLRVVRADRARHRSPAHGAGRDRRAPPVNSGPEADGMKDPPHRRAAPPRRAARRAAAHPARRTTPHLQRGHHDDPADDDRRPGRNRTGLAQTGHGALLPVRRRCGSPAVTPGCSP